MRRSTCLTDCALALFCVLLWVPIASGQQTSAAYTAPAARTAQPSAAAAGQSAPAQAQNQRESSYICSDSYSDRQTSRTTFYRTGVFQAAASLQTISDAWDRYVIKTYHLPDEPGPNCVRAPSDPAGQQYTQTYMDQSAQAHKAVIVHVDWKYVPDQDVRPPAESPSGLALGYCSSNSVEPPIYVSDIFGTNISVQGGDTSQIGNDYYQYLKQKYAYKSTSNYPVGCPIFRSRSSAEASKQKLETQWKQTHQQVIETGWKWVIPPGTPVQRPLSH